MLRIDSSGFTYYEDTTHGIFSCSTDLARFPMDTKVYLLCQNWYNLKKVCKIRIESAACDIIDMGFAWNSPSIEFASKVEMSQFKLEG